MVYKAVVIGTSTGGMAALGEVLHALPRNFPLPILIVQHISSRSDGFIVRYLNELSAIRVKEADEKEQIEAGCAYISPPNYHMMLDQDSCIALSVDSKVSYARPSIDVLFETAADVLREGLIGVILTGANSDGSKGIAAIKKRGGIAIVQDPATAEAEAMPGYAIKAAQVDYVLSLKNIGAKLIEIVGV